MTKIYKIQKPRFTLTIEQTSVEDRIFSLREKLCVETSERLRAALRRFASHVHVNEAGCWNWTSSQAGGKKFHYSIFRPTLEPGDRNQVYGHRFIFEVCFGVQLDEQVVRHSCDNSICVNPDHLVLGSHDDNMKDAVARDRTSHGTRNSSAKLTEQDVPKVLAMRESGMFHEDIADVFKVSRGAITRLLLGKSWVRVSGIQGEIRRNQRIA